MLCVRKLFLPWAASLLLVALSGCGAGGPKVVSVAGTLTYKGKPVTNAFIDFSPETGRMSTAETDEEGRFKLLYDRQHEGAIVGKHKVSVRMKPQMAAGQEPGMPPPRPSTEMAAFFNKYSLQNSKVEVTIDKSISDLKLDWD